MKNAPWVRLASRINPKIKEKPDDNKNSKAPSDKLLRPWMIQNCIVGRSCSCRLARSAWAEGLWLQVLSRRIVAGIDRVLQESSLVVGPELADVWIALYD